MICQRRKSRFWKVFFLNNSDFSKQNLRIIFAGEGAADDGGPFREFLRLAMNNIPKLSGLVFGKETEILFPSNPAYIAKKYYYSLGQLCAVAMLNLGRGPHCFHKSLVEAIFDKSNVDDIEITDSAFEEDVAQINSGDLVCLYNANINPSSNLEDAIKLYKLHYAILSRYAAINDFKSGIGSTSEKVLKHHPVFKRYFLPFENKISAVDINKLFNYNFTHEPGFQTRLKDNDAMLELEFLIKDIGDKSVDDVTMSDVLVFITACDVIPPLGFNKKIDVFFETKNQLATSSTCDLNFIIPIDSTRENVLKVLTLCRTLGSL